MAEFCRKYAEEHGNDPIYWESTYGPKAPKKGLVLQILCEGHGAWEWIDSQGYPVQSMPYFQGYSNAKIWPLLDEFHREMAMKFVARAPRQWQEGRKSVTDSDFDWRRHLDLEHVDAHLQAEYEEFKKAITPEDIQGECIDLANMAFLYWAWHKVRPEIIPRKIAKEGEQDGGIETGKDYP